MISALIVYQSTCYSDKCWLIRTVFDHCGIHTDNCKLIVYTNFSWTPLVMMAMLSYVIAAFVATCSAIPFDQASSAAPLQTRTENVGCQADVIEGKGDFKLQKKLYPVKNPGFYIESIKLLKRTSFYRCEPKAVKYGITEDSYSWWVDKGCEGLFEVVECPDINRSSISDGQAAKVDISIIQTYETPAPIYDIQEIQIEDIENRFVYHIPVVNL